MPAKPNKRAKPRRPLEGVRIIDMSTVLMGPFATQILGDYGADVIKIEPPAGDVMRTGGPMRSPGMGSVYLQVNRNKRSVVLDVKKPAGREAVRSPHGIPGAPQTSQPLGQERQRKSWRSIDLFSGAPKYNGSIVSIFCLGL